MSSKSDLTPRTSNFKPGRAPTPNSEFLSLQNSNTFLKIVHNIEDFMLEIHIYKCGVLNTVTNLSRARAQI